MILMQIRMFLKKLRLQNVHMLMQVFHINYKSAYYFICRTCQFRVRKCWHIIAQWQEIVNIYTNYRKRGCFQQKVGVWQTLSIIFLMRKYPEQQVFIVKNIICWLNSMIVCITNCLQGAACLLGKKNLYFQFSQLKCCVLRWNEI